MTGSWPLFESQTWPKDPTAPAAAPDGYLAPTAPPNPSTSEPPLSSQQVDTYRDNFYELIIKEVVKALTGFFTPSAGSAITQLGNFASNIPLIGPLVQMVTGVIGGGLEAIGTFFGNLTGLGGFLPFGDNLNSGTFDPISSAVNFISSILNPSGMLGGLFSGSLIPGLDGSKITSGKVSDSNTGVEGLRDTLYAGFSATPGHSGASNSQLETQAGLLQYTASSGLQSAAELNAKVAAQINNANSNYATGGWYLQIAPGGAPGAPLP